MSNENKGIVIAAVILAVLMVWYKDYNRSKNRVYESPYIPKMVFEKGLVEGQTRVYKEIEKHCPKLRDILEDVESITFTSYGRNEAWCPYDYLCQSKRWNKVVVMEVALVDNVRHIPIKFRPNGFHLRFKAGGGRYPGFVMRPHIAQYLCGIDPESLGNMLDGYKYDPEMQFIDDLNIEIPPEPEPVTGEGLFGNE